MLPSTYEELSRQRCDHCRANVPIDVARWYRTRLGQANQRALDLRGNHEKIDEARHHIMGWTDYTSFNVPNKWIACTAPTPVAAYEEAVHKLHIGINELNRIYFSDGYECPHSNLAHAALQGIDR